VGRRKHSGYLKQLGVTPWVVVEFGGNLGLGPPARPASAMSRGPLELPEPEPMATWPEKPPRGLHGSKGIEGLLLGDSTRVGGHRGAGTATPTIRFHQHGRLGRVVRRHPGRDTLLNRLWGQVGHHGLSPPGAQGFERPGCPLARGVVERSDVLFESELLDRAMTGKSLAGGLS